MNILVYPHQMVVGGSQINAIELAARVRDHGHNVTVVAPDGVLTSMVRSLGLPLILTATTSEYPSYKTCRQLVTLVRDLRIDLVHAYEWRPALEATFGPHLFASVPLVITILSMNIPKFLPTHVATVVGTRDLALESRASEVHVLEPPIDTTQNVTKNVAAARLRWSFREEEIVVAIVCRLTNDLDKLPGVLEAIEAIQALAVTFPVRLLIAGGGEGLPLIEERAVAANARVGRQVILPVGQMLDPREAYEAADIVLGMGSSVLRGMAFSKPVIVQGEKGFWRLLEPASLDVFLAQGWFGHGGRGVADLTAAVAPLIADAQKRLRLGEFGRRVVVEQFGLDQAASRLLEIYDQTVKTGISTSAWARSMVRCAARVTRFRTAMAMRPVQRAISRRNT